MRRCQSRLLIVLTVILALPAAGRAQDAALTGTVTDSTGGVLPGVTVTALHEASGNTFVTVTDERGTYRLPARARSEEHTSELQSLAYLVCRLLLEKKKKPHCSSRTYTS